MEFKAKVLIERTTKKKKKQKTAHFKIISVHGLKEGCKTKQKATSRYFAHRFYFQVVYFYNKMAGGTAAIIQRKWWQTVWGTATATTQLHTRNMYI